MEWQKPKQSADKYESFWLIIEFRFVAVFAHLSLSLSLSLTLSHSPPFPHFELHLKFVLSSPFNSTFVVIANEPIIMFDIIQNICRTCLLFAANTYSKTTQTPRQLVAQTFQSSLSELFRVRTFDTCDLFYFSLFLSFSSCYL